MPIRNKALLKGAPKKIVIRNFKKPPQLPLDFYEKTSKELLEGTLSVLVNVSKSASLLSLQNSYQDVVHLVSHQYGPRLYHDLRLAMRRACQLVLLDDHHDASAATLSSVLVYVSRQYQLFCDYLLLVKHIFSPLDRTHYWSLQTDQAVKGNAASSTASCLSVWQVGLQEFGDRLKQLHLDDDLYREWLQAFLQDWDANDDEMYASALASPDNRSKLQVIWYVWQDLGFLSSMPLQQDLEQYWTKQCTAWQQEHPYRAAAYVDFCYKRHAHVTMWPWLPASWLWSILEHCLLQPHVTKEYLLSPDHLYPILQDELAQQKQQPSLASEKEAATPTMQLWLLASRLPQGQALVGSAMAQFVKSAGLAIVEQDISKIQAQKQTPLASVNGTLVITDLLQLQEALQKLIASLPHGKEWINLKNAWEEVCNNDPGLAEQLAKFLDNILRNTKKLDQYQTSDDWLQKIMTGLFIPIQSKDIFEGFYRKDLAKRLLGNFVVSMDVEKQVCSLLKAECGAGYTSKLDGMFLDMDFSREIMMVYKQSQVGVAAGPVEMDAQVLTTGYWPVYPHHSSLILPDTLRAPQERFENHYMAKYQGRRITWQYSLGQCVVRATGFRNNKTYDLVVSLCQALVLIQFAASDAKFGIRKLMELVGLEDRVEMGRILLSLALGKEGTRILRKLDFEHDKKKRIRKTVDDRDEFQINSAFESNQRRIRIKNIMMDETKEEREKTVEAISRDRLYLIDAVLVRIMKARKTILHTQLIPQVLEQLKVPAQPADVKKRIETLIEREYMERDAKDRNRYNYLA